MLGQRQMVVSYSGVVFDMQGPRLAPRHYCTGMHWKYSTPWYQGSSSSSLQSNREQPVVLLSGFHHGLQCCPPSLSTASQADGKREWPSGAQGQDKGGQRSITVAEVKTTFQIRRGRRPDFVSAIFVLWVRADRRETNGGPLIDMSLVLDSTQWGRGGGGGTPMTYWPLAPTWGTSYGTVSKGPLSSTPTFNRWSKGPHHWLNGQAVGAVAAGSRSTNGSAHRVTLTPSSTPLIPAWAPVHLAA